MSFTISHAASFSSQSRQASRKLSLSDSAQVIFAHFRSSNWSRTIDCHGAQARCHQRPPGDPDPPDPPVTSDPAGGAGSEYAIADIERWAHVGLVRSGSNRTMLSSSGLPTRSGEALG